MAKNKNVFTRKLDFYLDESNSEINKLHKSRYVTIKKKTGIQALLASESIGIRKDGPRLNQRRSLPAKHNQWVSEVLFMTTPSPSKTVFFNSPAPSVWAWPPPSPKGFL